MNRPVWKLIFTFLLIFVGSGKSQNSPDRISFIPHWLPQAQFAGYYAAKDLGIYKKYNIDISILNGGPQNPSAEVLKRKEAEFASVWMANALKMREDGFKIVNIGQIVRKSVFMLIAKKSSGIKEPKDLDGRKVGIWEDFKFRPMQLFKQLGIKVKTVTLGSTINLFLMDGVDAATAMYYNEYHKIINAGLNPDELVTFFFSDYGLNFPEEGIYVYEDFYNKNEDLCIRFMRATIEGWIWCFKNPDKAIDIVVKYMKSENLPVNLSQQRWMLSSFKQIMTNENGNINTVLPEEDYNTVVKTMLETKLLKGSIQYNDFTRAAGRSK